MTGSREILRYTAFSRDPAGGNPAGVVLDATGLDDDAMLRIAADVGFSETAFLTADPDEPAETVTPMDAQRFRVRYFSRLAEVPFCGHATIAAAVALAERHGPAQLVLETAAGPVDVTTRYDEEGALVAALTTVHPGVQEIAVDDLDESLAALGWDRTDLDPDLPARLAYAGVWHPVLAADTRERLADLRYDYDRLARLMAARDWTTVQLFWRESVDRFHARDPFPPGGVVEDPATGAAAAALGAYLRDLALVDPPSRVEVIQGADMGRPSRLTVDIPIAGPITVAGHAVAIP